MINTLKLKFFLNDKQQKKKLQSIFLLFFALPFLIIVNKSKFL